MGRPMSIEYLELASTIRSEAGKAVEVVSARIRTAGTTSIKRSSKGVVGSSNGVLERFVVRLIAIRRLVANES